jgi:hypothetical protein
MGIGIQMPIWIVGIEPESFDGIGVRYEEMRRTAEENHLPCHDFASVLRLEVPPPEPEAIAT